MPSILLFNKPFQVLSQFTTDDDKATLADFIDLPNFYPAGRLDYDSEGLMLLTDHGPLQHLIASPQHKMPKTYWAQVEGQVTESALEALRQGVQLKDGLTQPAIATCKEIQEPWARQPPIRERQNIPTSWIELTITEGKNRQVRRMTAAVGFPTLRLIRVQIGMFSVTQLSQGKWLKMDIPAALNEELQHATRRKSQRRATTPNRGRHRRQKR